MAKVVKEWFDEEIKWAEGLEKKRTAPREKDYWLGYKRAMENAKNKLTREGII